MAFLCTCSEVEIMNSGNDSVYLRFWWTIWNPMLFCIISYIVLIIRQLQCLLCPEENIACTRFVQRFLRFSRPQTTQNNSQNFRLRNHNLLYKYNPAFCGLCKESWHTPSSLNNSYYLCTESKFEKIYETAYHSNCVINGSIVQC